jgi:hypothetical protein
MQDKCVIVEFIGIPYSKKTSTSIDLESALIHRRVRCKIIQEHRGSDEFYGSNKYSPLVNLLRAVHAIEEIIQNASDPRTDVVLIDRGLIDAQVWFHWFAGSQDVPDEYFQTLAALKKLSLLYSQKYRVVWMDRDPELATSAHGHQGRIINLMTLSQLRISYELVLPEVERDFIQHRVDSNVDSSRDIANRLVSQLKLA